MTRPDPLGNRKPADRLKEVRDEIARLKEIEDYIRRMILARKFDPVGDEWCADVTTRIQERLDRKALERDMDVSPYLIEMEVTTLRLKKVEVEMVE